MIKIWPINLQKERELAECGGTHIKIPAHRKQRQENHSKFDANQDYYIAKPCQKTTKNLWRITVWENQFEKTTDSVTQLYDILKDSEKDLWLLRIWEMGLEQAHEHTEGPTE